MALVAQIIAVSYNAILADKKKPSNQWAESAFLRELERQGGIDRQNLGPQIEAPLDFQRNPGAVIQTTDLQALSLAKTEVLTTALYTPAEITAPVVWSKKDEAMNPSENQKIKLATALIENAIESHDDLLEQYLFSNSTNGFLGLQAHVTAAQTGSSGGIDPASATWWKNQANSYTNDTDIEAGMTTTWNQCAKGSGAKLMPTLLVSDASTQSLFEGTQQALQRWVDEDEMKAGFKVIAFKTCRWAFSKNGGTRVFLWNPKSFQVVMSKGHFRELDETIPLENATGYTRRIYSAGQTVTSNRSRLGVAHT